MLKIYKVSDMIGKLVMGRESMWYALKVGDTNITDSLKLYEKGKR